MIDIPLTSSAREAVLISNTASFLLNRLLLDTSVQAASENFTGNELYKYFATVCANGPDSPESLTKAYVCFIGIGIAAEDDIWMQTTQLNTALIPWAQSIIALLDSSRTAAYSFEELTSYLPASSKQLLPDEQQWDDQEESLPLQEQLV